MLKSFKKKKNNKGFTLVELLVVIAIIGVLAVVAVPSLFKQIDKAKATQIVANVKALQTEVLAEYANTPSLNDVVEKFNKNDKAKINSIIDPNEVKFNEVYDVVILNSDGKYTTGTETPNGILGVQVKETKGKTKDGILDIVATQLGVDNDDTNGVILPVSTK